MSKQVKEDGGLGVNSGNGGYGETCCLDLDGSGETCCSDLDGSGGYGETCFNIWQIAVDLDIMSCNIQQTLKKTTKIFKITQTN